MKKSLLKTLMTGAAVAVGAIQTAFESMLPQLEYAGLPRQSFGDRLTDNVDGMKSAFGIQEDVRDPAHMAAIIGEDTTQGCARGQIHVGELPAVAMMTDSAAVADQGATTDRLHS